MYRVTLVPQPAPPVAPAETSPLPSLDPPHHPFLSRWCSTMHDDAFSSDVSSQSGATGHDPVARYFEMGAVSGMCPTFVFDDQGRALTIGFTAAGTDVMLFDPTSLQVLDSVPVPRRKGTALLFLTNPDAVFQSTAGGAYLFCDNQSRIVVPTASREIWIIAQREQEGAHAFDIEAKLDLRQNVSSDGIPLGDQLTATLPDWHQDSVYWFTSAKGLVGVVNRDTAKVQTMALVDPDSGEAEAIENSFSVGPDGAFVVSSHALYRFTIGPDHALSQVWRATYDRGETLKPGQLSQGSGTTPTLMGAYVAIGDNASIMNACVYRRENGVLASATPVFTASGSACENSFVGYNGSLVIGNTYGYVSPYATNDDQQGGLTRLDIDPDTGVATVVWSGHDDIQSSATPKLATGTGLVYCYTKQDLDGVSTWCVVGVDFRTGEKTMVLPVAQPEIQSVPQRHPLLCYDRFDNGWGPITIGLDSWERPSTFIGMIEGFLQIADGSDR